VALTAAYDAIVVKRPIGNLMSKFVIISLFGQIFIQLMFQILLFSVLQLQSW